MTDIFSQESIKDLLGLLMDMESGIVPAIWDTIYSTLLASLFAILIGLPLGVLLVVGEKGGIRPLPKWVLSVLNFVINILRSVPFIILMILAFPLTKLIIGRRTGTLASVVPLVIAAFPFVARLVESSLREINPNIVEMAQSLGASPMQIICKVLIPECLPSLISNFTIAITTILGYGAMSGAVGGGGLGNIAIMYGYQRYQTLIMIVTVVLLILLVQVLQTIGTRIAIKCDKRTAGRHRDKNKA